MKRLSSILIFTFFISSISQASEGIYNDLQACDFYPTTNEVVNWQNYLATIKPAVVDLKRKKLQSVFFTTNTSEMKVVIDNEKLVMFPTESIYMHKVSYAATTRGACFYPSISVYANKNDTLLLVDEWQTAIFYVAQHIYYENATVSSNRLHNSFLGYKVFYKEKVGGVEKVLLLRKLFLKNDVDILYNAWLLRKAEHVRLIINTQNGVNFGNLSTWWQGRDYTYELALIDLYYFKTLDGRDVYQLEWAAPQTAHLEAYTKLNFDAAKKRVRIMFIDLDLNSEAKFFGEYINLETASVIKFIGERGQRQEVY